MTAEIFILIAYIVGTYMGFRLGKVNPQLLIESTIDKLVADGYIKTVKNSNNEIELLKHWEMPKEVDSESK